MNEELFDKYACAALTGLLANPAVLAAVSIESRTREDGIQTVASAALRYAQESLKIREKAIGSINQKQP